MTNYNLDILYIMGRHSRTKYIRGYGYIRYLNRDSSINSIHGDGIGDIFSSIFKAGSQILTKIPNQIIDASKKALLNVGSSTIKAIGSKVGDTIADNITKKTIDTSKIPSQDIPSQEIRKQILKELTFEHPSKPNEENVRTQREEPIPNTAVSSTITNGIPADLYKKFYGSGRKRGKSLIGAGIKIL
jgi:hypothetical protein